QASLPRRGPARVIAPVVGMRWHRGHRLYPTLPGGKRRFTKAPHTFLRRETFSNAPSGKGAAAMNDTTPTPQPSTSGADSPRRQAVELLSQQHVDRAALESLRADQLKLAENASQRLTQALADVADVLTPEQRQQLAERINRRHGHRE